MIITEGPFPALTDELLAERGNNSSRALEMQLYVAQLASGPAGMEVLIELGPLVYPTKTTDN